MIENIKDFDGVNMLILNCLHILKKIFKEIFLCTGRKISKRQFYVFYSQQKF